MEIDMKSTTKSEKKTNMIIKEENNIEVHDTILEKLNFFINKHTIPNIIFHGTSGSGKRTIMNTFIQNIYKNNKDAIKDYVMYVNCAQGKGIKFIREDLKHFAKMYINTHGGNFFKSIILLNADKLTIDAQSALRRCIEVFSHTTRFFIVVEDKYTLLKPILSRFCEIYIPEPIVKGKYTNLYKYNIERTYKNSRSNISRNTELKKILTDLYNNKDIDVETISNCVNELYDKAYSVRDITYIIDTKLPFNIDTVKKYNTLFRYNEMKPEFRNEAMSMFFLLTSLFLSSNEGLENMLLM